MRGARVDEFALIDAFLEPFGLSRSGAAGPRGAGVLRGPGDDCAVLAPARGQLLAATTDAVVEGVHFDLSVSSAEDAGHKALAVNLSDLAAAGARPRWFLCALGVPRIPASLREVVFATARGLGRGMARLARRHGCVLAGGNVCRADRWSLTLTALGEGRRLLSRTGARPGDALVVAGGLGAAVLGLRLLARRRGADPGPAGRRAMRAQTRPVPLVEAGRAAAPFAAAAVDVSDGFLADLGHLLQASGCGAEIDCARLPRPPAVRAAEQALVREDGAHPFALSLAGGEDYALIFAVRPPRLEALLGALRGSRTGARIVGHCVPGKAIALHRSGHPLPLPARRGFDHLEPPA